MKATTKPVWILVADSSTARLFSAENSASDLIEIETLNYADMYLTDQRVANDVPDVLDKEHVETHFAKRVVKHLNKELNHNKFERLFIVAAPSFLGSLRGEFNNRIEKQVSFSLGKNIVNLPPSKIRSHLPHSLAS